MGLSAAQPGAAPAAASSPTYDEQIGTTFTQEFTSLTYNVTALAQVDADGYGPAYILNGLTAAGYWYQVGISYHWPSSGGTYDPAFGFSYQVFGPNGKPVYPANGGAGLGGFSKTVQSGDSVLLSLTFSGPTIQMLAQDWNTGASAKTSYSSAGSSKFVGNPSNPSNSLGFFTGLMTEWYHVLPYSGNEGKVTYTNQAVALSSAWLWLDEFNSASSGPPVFSNQTQTPVIFASEQQLYPFASNGATMYGSAHQFITGLLDTASSRVALTPATAEAASQSFAASYTLAGLRQSAEIAAGTGTVVEADPGTFVTISINSSGSSALERWVFSGTGGSAVTFSAGSDATFVYYDLVQETVSYHVTGSGNPLPASAAPELIYYVPPAAASATPAYVPMTQLLGTAPVQIYAILGSNASLTGAIPGEAGERWAASAQGWSVSAPNAIPNPIQLYQQYEVSVSYSVIGGGTPPRLPEVASTSLGSPAAIHLSGGVTTGWFDAGSAYSLTNVLNGSTPAERWLDSGANASAPSVISSPGQALSEVYTHQYYTNFGVNDPRGGSVSPESGWLEAGSSLHVGVTSNPQWQFEMFNGTGGGAYTGTRPAVDVTVTGPLSEEATFYAQLAIAADAGTDIAFSYGSVTGTVQAGATKTIYVPPSSNVTLRASPSIFVYSFASWQGTGFAKTTRPLLVLVVDSPGTVAATSSYNYPAILAGGAAVALAILASSLWIRSRRRRERLGGFGPGAA
jgi:hypothetical protein